MIENSSLLNTGYRKDRIIRDVVRDASMVENGKVGVVVRDGRVIKNGGVVKDGKIIGNDRKISNGGLVKDVDFLGAFMHNFGITLWPCPIQLEPYSFFT